jgi:hypothetical protein
VATLTGSYRDANFCTQIRISPSPPLRNRLYRPTESTPLCVLKSSTVCHSIVCLSPPLCVHVDAAKYLLIRLCLRKSGKWHRLNSLKYQHELGEEIAPALKTLCVHPRQYSTEERPIKQEEREIIDLTLDDEIDTIKPSSPFTEQSIAEAGPSSIKIEDLSLSEKPCGDLSFFAQDHTHAELSELLECLSLEELRLLAKDMKIRSFSLNVSKLSIPVLKFSVLLVQRVAIEEMLINQASSQSTLPFLSVHKGSKASRRSVAPKPLRPVGKSQCDRLRQMVIRILGTSQLPLYTLTWTDYLIGTCVRVNESVFTLLRRLNLIYFRWYAPFTSYLCWRNVEVFQHAIYPGHSNPFHPFPCTEAHFSPIRLRTNFRYLAYTRSPSCV